MWLKNFIASKLGGNVTATSTTANSKRCMDVIVLGANGEAATVNSEGRADVTQHAHPNNGSFHFAADVSATTDFIILDISDTVNYPHVETGYAHIEHLMVQVEASNTADYNISFGYLENVDGTNGDYHEMYSMNGDKTVGRNKAVVLPVYPNGDKMTSTKTVTSIKSLNDTAFQTDVNLGSTLDPGTADTPSGDGDLVMRITITAGTLNVSLNGAYHTHA